MRDDEIVVGTAKAKFSPQRREQAPRRYVRCTVAYARQLIALGVAEFKINNKPPGRRRQSRPGRARTKAEGVPRESPRRADGWPINRIRRRRARLDGAFCRHPWRRSESLRFQGDGLRRLASSKVDRDGRPLAIIAVNNAYQVAPQADVLYYADGRWWTWHKDKPEYRPSRPARNDRGQRRRGRRRSGRLPAAPRLARRHLAQSGNARARRQRRLPGDQPRRARRRRANHPARL
jgi:hypothetical protein